MLLLASNRKNVPFEYLLLEGFLIAAAFCVCLCSGLAVVQIWGSAAGSFKAISGWVVLAAWPIASIWNHFATRDLMNEFKREWGLRTQGEVLDKALAICLAIQTTARK